MEAYCLELPTIKQNNPQANILYNDNPLSLVGDCNGDCRVNLHDFEHISNKWLNTNCGDCDNADLNGDNDITILDVLILSEHWLECNAPDCI